MIEKCPCGMLALFSPRYCSATCRRVYRKAYQKSDRYKAYLKAYYLRKKEAVR